MTGSTIHDEYFFLEKASSRNIDVCPSIMKTLAKHWKHSWQIVNIASVFIVLLLTITACKPNKLVAISPDIQALAAGDYFSITLFNIYQIEGEIFMLPVEVLGGPLTEHVCSLAFSPDGSVLAVGGDVLSVDEEIFVPEIKLVDSLSGRVLYRIPFGRQQQMDQVLSITFSHDGMLLAAGSMDKVIRLFDFNSGREVSTFTLDQGPTIALTFSPDNQVLAASTLLGVELWNRNTGERRIILQENASHLNYTPDGRTLVIGTISGEVVFYNTLTNELILKIQAHSQSLSTLALNSDGTLLATSGGGKVNLWDTGSLEQIASWDYPALSMVFSPEDEILFVSDGEEIRVIDLRTLHLHDK